MPEKQDPASDDTIRYIKRRYIKDIGINSIRRIYKGIINMEKKNIITKINDGFCKVEKTITWVAFAFMLALLLIQVFCRYLFEMPLAWAEELVRYTYIAVSFLGAAVALRERTHISIDILPSLLENKIKDEIKRKLTLDFLNTFADIVQTALFIVMTIWMAEYTIDLDVKNQITTANQWPMWLMSLPVTVSCGLMAFHGLLNTLEDIIDIIKNEKARKVVA